MTAESGDPRNQLLCVRFLDNLRGVPGGGSLPHGLSAIQLEPCLAGSRASRARASACSSATTLCGS